MKTFCFAFAVLPAQAFACLQGYHLEPSEKSKNPTPVRPLLNSRIEVKSGPLVVPFDLRTDLIAPPPIDIQKTALPTLGEEALPTGEAFRARLRGEVARFEVAANPKASFEDKTDYAVALIFLERQLEAIPLLHQLEEERPGVYTTAANLGTAYELAGSLAEAKTWIRRGIERNPGSHAGTEWLHLAILEAKVRLKSDPGWLGNHSVLSVAKGKRTDDEIRRAIDYQMNERLRFVSGEDTVVCDLFYQAAVRSRDPADAAQRKRYLEQSLRFGDLRRTEIEKLSRS